MNGKGCILNVAGIKLLKTVEKSRVKYCSEILLSTSSLHTYSRKIELMDEESFPVTPCEEKKSIGEEFGFDL